MLKMCGETEEKLAQELIQFENQIERDVVEPLYVLAEVRANDVQYVATGMCDKASSHCPKTCRGHCKLREIIRRCECE